MTSDGIFLYHPVPKKFNIFKGIKDTVPYYHSRHAVFIIYTLELINVNPSKYLKELKKAGDTLLSYYKENGEKIIWFDTKRWYWNNTKELASNSFAFYFLSKLGQLTSNTTYLEYAQKTLEKLLKELPKGFENNFDDFQCAFF